MGDVFQHLDLPPNVASAALPLNASGVHELAWSRADALRVLDYLAGRPIAVLGGDVLSSVEPLEYAHANWHAERQPDEGPHQYVARSQNVAREYIHRYPGTHAWFVLVLEDEGGIATRSPNDR
ncbi:MAG: hypothetical protein ACJ79K_16000 [Gemmatimonadaceae bacterium]